MNIELEQVVQRLLRHGVQQESFDSAKFCSNTIDWENEVCTEYFVDLTYHALVDGTMVESANHTYGVWLPLYVDKFRSVFSVL